MIHFKRSTHRRLRRRERASVLVLVVATLGLLVVIGTVYVLSSRMERNNAQTMSTAVNLDLARDAVMSNVQQTIGNAMVDDQNRIGGYGTAIASRNFDYPETGTAAGVTSYNPGMKSEAWLVGHLHYPTSAVMENEYSLLTQSPYVPSSGSYVGSFAAPQVFNVVNDQTATGTDKTLDDPPAPLTTGDSYINLLPFSDASGVRYRFGVRIIDTNRMANLNAGCPVDSTVWNNGTAVPTDISGAYPTSLRLAPINSWPAQNAYFNTNDSTQAVNLHYKSTPDKATLGRVTANFSDTTFNNVISALSYTTPSLTALPSVYTWQKQMFLIEGPDLQHPGAADSANRQSFVPFDLADELELRSYGEFGTSYHVRPALSGQNGDATYQMWPYTLSAEAANQTSGYYPRNPSNTVTGNASRRNFTTYSFSRDIRALPDPATIYTLSPLPSGATAAWPTSAANTVNARVSANPMLDITKNNGTNDSNNAMEYIAMAATNLATAMEGCGFSHQEALSFAANYTTARWNGFCLDTNGGFYLPNGPSFVDNKGLCVRTAIWTGTSVSPGAITPLGQDFTGTLITLQPNIVYLGYSAQPFINEIAENEDTDTTLGAPGVPSYVDTAVELFNPYPVPLSLNGYHLFIGTVDVPLNSSAVIPAKGYYVMTGPGAHFSTSVANSATVQTAIYTGLVVTQGMTSAVLCRPYAPRPVGSAMVLAAVDVMDLTKLLDPNGLPDAAGTPKGVPTDESVQRSNDPILVSPNLWGASVAIPVTRFTGDTLGLKNNINTNSPAGYPLADRFAQVDSLNNDLSAFQLSPMGMGEFSRTIRLANQSAPGASGSPPTLINTVSMQLSTIAGAVINENQMRFDFLPSLSAYNANPPTDTPAVKLLNEITMVDRVSDYSNAVNGIAGFDIQKIRVPGLINVNTASGDVLRAIPNMTDQMVTNILAYRSRTNPTNPQTNYNGKQSTTDYSVAATYPGMGIRSLAELLVPLAGLTPIKPINPDQYFSGSMDNRDQAWGSIYNLCTVRSDTFAVYGYMEAVRQNPKFGGFLDSSTTNQGWYTPSTDPTYTATSTIDDPHNSGPLIRVARRRWVAIVDRSFSNYAAGSGQFVLPRVVAIKDLPQ